MPSTRKGQMAKAILGQLTTDPYMAAAGALPLEHRDRTQNMGQGLYERGGEFGRVPGYEAAVNAAAQRSLGARKQALREQLEMGVEKERSLLGMPTRTQAAEARRTSAFLPRIKELAMELVQGDFEIPSSVETAAKASRSLPFVGETASAGIERVGMSPEAVSWLAKGRQAESDIIRRASGLAVTGFELENVKSWSPWASGLNKPERLDRMENIYNKLGGEASATMNTFWEDVQFDRGTLQGIKRPKGATDEEWQLYLQSEGM